MKFTGSSKYKVVITHTAKAQVAHILRYLRQDLRNEQAARNVKEDLEETKLRLSYTAESLKLCDDAELRALGYRTIHLKRHRYLLLYKIINDTVRVDGVYHDLQDYENILH